MTGPLGSPSTNRFYGSPPLYNQGIPQMNPGLHLLFRCLHHIKEAAKASTAAATAQQAYFISQMQKKDNPSAAPSLLKKIIGFPGAAADFINKVASVGHLVVYGGSFYAGRNIIASTIEFTTTFFVGKENYNWLAHNFCQIPGLGYITCEPATVHLGDGTGAVVAATVRGTGAVVAEGFEQGTSFVQDKVNSFTTHIANNIETSVNTLASFVTGGNPSEKKSSLPFTTDENVFSQNNTGREPFSLNMGTVALLAAGVALVYFGEKAISKYFASSETMAEEPKKEKIKAK